MVDDAHLRAALASISSAAGNEGPIGSVEFEGLRDEPGFHWSNPGLGTLIVSADGRTWRCVLETLGKHSRREALIYRYLATEAAFPMPRLHHAVIDDGEQDYWMILEECEYRHFPEEPRFWEEVATLLATIHARFWNRTDVLPEFFQQGPRVASLAGAYRALAPVLTRLTRAEIKVIADEWNLSLEEVATELRKFEFERMSEPAALPLCLVHGAFHPPEIMWRRSGDGYEPVGVDWENARAGVAGDDVSILADLLASGEQTTFDRACNRYLATLGAFGIDVSRDPLTASAILEAVKHRMGVELPWIIPRYLAERNDPAFDEWSRWVRENIPIRVRFMMRVLRRGRFDESG